MQSFRKRILTLACVAAAGASQAKDLGSFAPPNSRRIPDNAQTLDAGGLTKEQFNAVLDKLQAYYAPIVKKKGGTLSISRKWSNDTVNASAQQIFWYYVINMYGGLARYSTMTPDAFMLVACHETGHHLGGAPKIDGNSWASNEGQSDYFATLQCFRNLVGQEDHVAFMKGKTIHPVAAAACTHVYADAQERALCERSAFAGQILADMLGDLGGTGPTNYGTPDPSVVSKTDDEHPAAQCRLDTYLAAATCNESPTAALSDKDPNVGTCHIGDGRDFGARPRCWYAPASARATTGIRPTVLY